MFRDHKAYGSTIPTDLPWCGEVPAHWRIRRAKTLMRTIDVRSQHGDEELLTVSSRHGVVRRSTATVNMFKAESYIGHKLCWPGDLVINSLWAWGKGLGVSHNHGIVSTAYGVYRLRSRSEIRRDYLHHLVRSEPFQWELQVRSRGVWKSRLQLTDERWLDAPLLLPPVDEQGVIVKYLAHANARIDKAIAAKRKLISLLEEQKLAVIEDVVGGREATNFVDSEVVWLGGIPRGWSPIRVKWCVHSLEQGWSPQCDAQQAAADEWGVLKTGCSNYGVFRETENKRLPEALDPRPQYEVKEGDILVSRANTLDLVGSAAIARSPRPRLMLSDKTFRLRADRNVVDADFLVLAMRLKSSRAQIEAGAVGASHSMQNIGQSVIRNLWLAIPNLSDQNTFASEVENRTMELNKTIDRANREIALLREFSTRLTADVVTGQVDVRLISENLPDLESGHYSLDQIDTELEDSGFALEE